MIVTFFVELITKEKVENSMSGFMQKCRPSPSERERG